VGSGVCRAILVNHLTDSIPPARMQLGARNVERLRDSYLRIV
jgi:hypothetical protein